jgi:hypothetical protein
LNVTAIDVAAAVVVDDIARSLVARARIGVEPGRW